MTSEFLVEFPTGEHGTSAADEVEAVAVGEGACVGPHVEMTTGEGAVVEVPNELRVVVQKVVENVAVEGM